MFQEVLFWKHESRKVWGRDAHPHISVNPFSLLYVNRCINIYVSIGTVINIVLIYVWRAKVTTLTTLKNQNNPKKKNAVQIHAQTAFGISILTP